MKIFSWGANKMGQRCSGDFEDATVPEELCSTNEINLSTIINIFCDSNVTVVLLEDGRVFACGDNSDGQLGAPEREIFTSFIPVSIDDSGIRVRSVAIGWDFTVVLTKDGDVFTAGKNNRGQLGLDFIHDSAHEFMKIPIPKIKSIRAGLWHVVALTENNEILTWGYNHRLQLGVSPKSRKPMLPEKRDVFNGKAEIKFIIAGAYHSGLMTVDFEFIMWGDNQHGQCGLLSNENVQTFKIISPTRIYSNSLKGIVKFESGWNHNLVLDSNGRCYSWGQNRYYQLGRICDLLNSSNNDFDPVPNLIDTFVARDVYVMNISCGSQHNLVVDANGSLWSWGWNDHGMLGHGDTIDRRTPEVISKFSSHSISLISQGGAHCFAISTNCSDFI